MVSEVEILGKKYAIRSDTEDTFTRETAELVNAKMRELMSKGPMMGPEKVAVITAMNLAGELLKTKHSHQKLQSSVRKKTKNLIQLIDQRLK